MGKPSLRADGSATSSAGPANWMLADRLLAEATRVYEQSLASPIACQSAVVSATRGFPDNDESLLIERARLLDTQTRLVTALARTSGILRVLVTAGLLLAFAAGVGMAGAALSGKTASVFGLLFGLLGIQTALLLVWLCGMLLYGRRSSGGLLGRVVFTAAEQLLARYAHDPRHSAALAAIIEVSATPRIARWTFSCLTHNLWLAANLGILLHMAVLFIGEGYQFRWDSTWLSSGAYVQFVDTVAAAPRSLGFPTPDADQIASSRAAIGGFANQDAEDRRTWAWLFFGSVVVYGAAPRTVLSAWSWMVLRRRRSQFRLDVEHPSYSKLLASIRQHGTSRSADKAHSRAAQMSDAEARVGTIARAATSDRPPGTPIVLGLEMSEPACGWPPPFERTVADLGLVDGREDERRAVEAIRSATTAPAPLIIFAQHRTSPDRGVSRVLSALSEAAGARVALVLTAARPESRDERSQDDAFLDRRIADWRLCAQEAGIDASDVYEIDLDHLTAATRARLSAIVEGSLENSTQGRLLESAFERIEAEVTKWPSDVSARRQLSLFEDIARIYGHERRRAWLQSMLGDTGEQRWSDPRALHDSLAKAAKNFGELLPDALRIGATWSGVGALGGALGCVAAAFAAPVVLGSLPAWSVLGGAIAGVLSLTKQSRDKNADADRASEADILTAFSASLRAATLYAVTLELQGRGEAYMTRVISRTFRDDRAQRIEDVRAWLTNTRHSFDLALAEEKPAQ